MPGPLLVLKAYKLKRAAKRLMKAKENALRICRGERPHYPWYEETWTWCVECLKNNFCKAFCPCWLARKKREHRFEDSYSKSFLRRPCLDGTFENYAIKSFLGFLFGLLLTAAAFFFFLDQLNINPRVTTAFCCVLGMVLSTALAFSEEARCITFLALPELFSGRGRMVLMATTYILVMSGPAKNAMRNANILVESMNCGQEILIKQTKAILSSIFAPLIAIIDTMRDILAALKSFARQVKDAFIAIRDLFMEISMYPMWYQNYKNSAIEEVAVVNAIRNMFRWLQSMVNVCNNKYGTPYERCNKAFDDAIEDCNKKLGVFKFLCYIVNVVQYVCEVAKIVDLLCLIPKAVKSGIIEPLKEQVKTFARNIYNQFYVNVTFVHYYNYSLEQSKSFEEIRVDIANEIRKRTEWLTNVVDWADFSLAFVLLFLFIKAHLYRIRYLTADHFDNVYISFYIKDIDDRRLEMGKETILPLTNRERRKYVNAFSLRMARSERRSLMVAATLLLISGLQMGFYMILDYSLYQLLSLIRYYGRLEAKGQLPAVVQIQVKGDGVMADLYRQMVTRFDPLMSSVPEFDTAQCLPVPLPVDLDRYQRIGIMYGICLLLAVTQSYGLRLRHVICGCYYPQREKARAVWLYNHILKTRGSLQKFLSNQIRRRVYGDDTVDKISFLERLSHQSKLIGRILKAVGYVKIYCVCCNEAGKPEDYENFKRCSTPGCNGIYCLPCFEDIRNVCELCTKPVEYEDPDFSEEKDSSEEEERDKNYDHSVQKEESDEEDYEYQYDEAKSLEDISVSSSSDSEPRKRKRRLARMDDLEDDDEEEKV